MAGSVNKAMVIGRLGADPEIRNGRSRFATFRLATSERWRDKQTGEQKEHTDWHSVVIFNEHLVEIAEKYLKKGSLVYIAGKMQTRTYEGRGGQEQRTTEIVLNNFGAELSLLEPKGSDRPPPPEGAGDYGDQRDFSSDDYRKATGR